MKKVPDAGAITLFDVDEASKLAGYDPDSPNPPDAWPDFSRPIPTEFCCPRCAYAWRGNPKPGADEASEAER